VYLLHCHGGLNEGGRQYFRLHAAYLVVRLPAQPA